MAQDRNGNNHKAAGRPDGGQFDRKAGQGSDDDLDLEAVDARRRVFDAVVAGDDDGVDPETARRIRYAIRLTPDRDPDKVFANMRRNGTDSMLDRHAGQAGRTPTASAAAMPHVRRLRPMARHDEVMWKGNRRRRRR